MREELIGEYTGFELDKKYVLVDSSVIVLECGTLEVYGRLYVDKNET